jgi:voltage-gated potassium channel
LWEKLTPPMPTDSIFVNRKKPTKIKKESRKLSFILYEAIYGPIAFVQTVYRQLIILAAMFASGAAVFSYFEKLNVLDSLLASISTITTIGLYVPHGGNFAALNPYEAALLIVLIIVSVGSGASILQSTISAVVSGNLAKGEAEKRMISRLKGHVIVLGYTHLGRYVVDKLQQVGVDYVIVTRDPQLYNDLLSKNMLAVLEHQSQPVAALKAAGIDKAMMVVVCHNEDPDNMLLVLSARKIRPDVRIVTVVHDTALVETAKNAGADVAIPSAVTVGHLLALSAVTKDLVGIVFSEKIGTKEIAQFSVFRGSRLIGQGLQVVSKYAVIIGVVRDNEVLQHIFDPDFKIREGDTLLVLGDPSNLHILEEEAEAT